MGVHVDIGITAGAADTSAYWHIGHPTRGKIGVAAIPPDDLAADYSTRVMSLTVSRPSSRTAGPLTEYQAGTATVVLTNDDGALDPTNITEQIPGSVLRIRYTHNGITYPVFTGNITSLLPDLHSPTHATVTIHASDGFEDLANNTRIPTAPLGSGEDTGARVGRILDSVSWPADARDLDTGKSVLQATTLEGSALEEAQRAVLAEAGELYINADGVVVFRNRHAILTETRSNTSQATFGSDYASGELMYVGALGLSNDRSELANTVRATRAGGTQQSVSDATSIARHRVRVHEESDLPLTTDAETLSWARYVLGAVADPEFRVTSMTVDVRINPDLLIPQALGRELGDRITVVRRPPGVVDSRQVLIRSIEHQYTRPGKWVTTWGLQPAATYAFWTIGNPDFGRVGVNAIAY